MTSPATMLSPPITCPQTSPVRLDPKTSVTELEMVICSPSRIQAAPSPATIRVGNGLQLNRSSRAGMVESNCSVDRHDYSLWCHSLLLVEGSSPLARRRSQSLCPSLLWPADRTIVPRTQEEHITRPGGFSSSALMVRMRGPMAAC